MELNRKTEQTVILAETLRIPKQKCSRIYVPLFNFRFGYHLIYQSQPIGIKQSTYLYKQKVLKFLEAHKFYNGES